MHICEFLNKLDYILRPSKSSQTKVTFYEKELNVKERFGISPLNNQ